MERFNLKKKICFYTGNRGEFSLIKPLIQKVIEIEEINEQILVSGSHLEIEYGETIKEILNSGFKINYKTEPIKRINQINNTSYQIAQSINQCSEAFKKLCPDFVVIYGDRFEAFGACIAASQSGIPVIHIEGGDITEGGCLDDNVRHAMTKLSHLHCVTNFISYKRVALLGEEKWRIANIGLPCLDNIFAKEYASKKELIKKFELDLEKPLIIFTQHPVSSEINDLNQHISNTTKALVDLYQKESVQIICTYPNNDEGSEIIIEKLKKISENMPGIKLYKSLGGYYYHGLLSLAMENNNCIISIGNSSSGIKETSSFNCPHINIGNRQSGRLGGKNIINVGYSSKDIYSKVNFLLKKENRSKYQEGNNPYWNNGAGNCFKNFLKEFINLKKEIILLKKIRQTTLDIN